jgi:hypothetical protein
MSFAYKLLNVEDFSGGITDKFIDAPLRKYEEADNMLITVNHKLETRNGSQIYDATDFRVPNSLRVGNLIDHFGELFALAGTKLYYFNPNLTELTGPSGNSAFTTGDTTSVSQVAQWNKHTFISNSDFSPIMKVFRDNSNTLRLRSAGLPALASSPTVTPTAGTFSYLYAFIHVYEYQVGTVTFLDFGPITEVSVSNMEEPSVGAASITSIPVLANGATDNFDTTNVNIRIYRTEQNATTFYQVGEVSNGTTTFNDTFSDAAINVNTTLYNTGGQLDNDPPPPAKAIHITNNVGYYGHVKQGTEILGNRLRASIPGDPDSCPESIFLDLDDEIVAISSVGKFPVIFCEKSTYRIDGVQDALGSSIWEAQEIESTVGCVSAASVVQINKGVAFAGEDGFYYTDGFLVTKISEGFNDRYADLVETAEQKRRIFGTFDRIYRRVWWSVQEEGQTEVNKIFVWDTRFGAEPDSAFTTASGADTFFPTALLFDGRTMVRGDKDGYLYKHLEEYTTDPAVQVGVAPTSWETQTIRWDFKHVATSFGDSNRRKYVPRITFTAENETNVSVQITSSNDVGRRVDLHPAIRFRKNLVWGDDTLIWGGSGEVWNFRGIIEQERRVNAESLRCSYKQIQVSNAYVVIENSDTTATATVNTTADTVLLDDTINFSWPDDIVDYFISFDFDSYVTQFQITSRSATTLVVLDPAGQLQNGSHKWMIKGYPRGEVLKLLKLSLYFAYLGSPEDFNADVSGENAT